MNDNLITLTKDDRNEEAEELVKRTDIEGTPFTIIETDGKIFGVMGKYRITEPAESFELVKAELKQITWNRILQMIIIVTQEQESIKELLKEENK